MTKLNNVEIHLKHSNRTYNTMTAFLVMRGNLRIFEERFRTPSHTPSVTRSMYIATTALQ